jgi:hypothetical protein
MTRGERNSTEAPASAALAHAGLPRPDRQGTLAALGAAPDVYASVQGMFDGAMPPPDDIEPGVAIAEPDAEVTDTATPGRAADLHHWLDWAEQTLGTEHPVTIALLNKSVADSAARRPDTSQDWSRLNGALAFQVIGDYAESPTETGEMMETWGKARYANVDVLPTEAAALLQKKAETLRDMFRDLECKVCSDNISLAPQRNMIQQLIDMTSTLFEPVETLQGQPQLRNRDRRNFEIWLKSVSGVANLKRRRPSGQYIDPATYWAWRAFTAPVESGELPPNFFEQLELKIETLLTKKSLLTAHADVECARCGYETSNAEEQEIVRSILNFVVNTQIGMALQAQRGAKNPAAQPAREKKQ